MKRVAAVAMLMAALLVPAVAQHGAAHGAARGGSGGPAFSAPRSSAPHMGGFAPRTGIGVRPSPGPVRFAPGSPGGMRPSAPRGFGYPGSYPGAPLRFGSHNGPAARIPYNRLGADHAHGPGHDPGHGHGDGDHHHHHRGVYWGGSVYPYYPWFYTGPIFTGYVDPWLFGPHDYYGYGYGDDVPAPYRDYGMQDSQPYPAEYYQGNPALPAQDSASRQPYAGQPSEAETPAVVSAASPSALPERPVTLIFNDGRPPVQIHNYLITASTLTVLDAQYREIPLDKINVAATQQANRSAGVDFRVPAKQ